MTTANIANALQRVRTIFARRPEAAVHPDDPAIARWEEGMRVVSHHANGTRVTTDMPRELGGEGGQVTPGWLLRASLASCLATRIVMEAAAREIAVTRLEVTAASTSDTRGMLGMTGDTGERIVPGPLEVQLKVSIAAANAETRQLQAMVEESFRCSPVPAALCRSVAVSLRVDIDPAPVREPIPA